MCLTHAGEMFGVPAATIAQLLLVRSDVFEVWSVEELKRRGLFVERIRDAEGVLNCEVPYVGNCLGVHFPLIVLVPEGAEAIERAIRGELLDLDPRDEFDLGQPPKVYHP
jgi:pyruvate dehydrogenase complex dehydrogenase (E1) component